MKDLDWPRAVVYAVMIVSGIAMVALGLDKALAASLISAGIAGAWLPPLTGQASRKRQIEAAVDKALSVPPIAASDVPSITLPIDVEQSVESREAPTSPGIKHGV